MYAISRAHEPRDTGDEPTDGTPAAHDTGTWNVDTGSTGTRLGVRPAGEPAATGATNDAAETTRVAVPETGPSWGALGVAGAGVLALGTGVLLGRGGGTLVSRLLIGGGAVLLGAGLLTGCGRVGRDADPKPTPPPTPPPTTTPTPGNEPTAAPTTTTPHVSGTLRIAQLNAHNLFDTVDQERVQDDVSTPRDYERQLGKLALAIRDAMGAPDVIAMQEVENEQVLRDLAARPELRDLGYEPLIVEGSDPRGIDVAYLYRPAKAELISHEQLQTTYVSASGRTTKVFTRPPLVATFRPTEGTAQARDGARLTIVNNHFTSKLQGADGEAKRLRQAAFVASIADGRAGAANLDPERVIVLGDLNEDLDDPAYGSLVAPASEGGAPARINAASHLPEADRYSWRDGTKRSLLDHVLLTPTLDATVRSVRIPHINSDPSVQLELEPGTYLRSSDHDPVIVELSI